MKHTGYKLNSFTMTIRDKKNKTIFYFMTTVMFLSYTFSNKKKMVFSKIIV